MILCLCGDADALQVGNERIFRVLALKSKTIAGRDFNMRMLATLLFFPLLWLRGFVSFGFGLLGGIATLVLTGLAVGACFSSRYDIEYYAMYFTYQFGYRRLALHLHYWPMVLVALAVAFGSFLVRYFYDRMLFRLNWFRTGYPMSPLRMI